MIMQECSSSPRDCSKTLCLHSRELLQRREHDSIYKQSDFIFNFRERYQQKLLKIVLKACNSDFSVKL